MAWRDNPSLKYKLGASSTAKAVILQSLRRHLKIIYVGGYTGSSSSEYFNATAQTSLFSLSKHLHTYFLFPSLWLVYTHSTYQLFNFPQNSFPPFQTTWGIIFLWIIYWYFMDVMARALYCRAYMSFDNQSFWCHVSSSWNQAYNTH